MRIRLHGTPAETRRTLASLAEVLNIHEVSRPYPRPVTVHTAPDLHRGQSEGGEVITLPTKLFMSTEELAELLDVDPSTIRRWRTVPPHQGPPFIQISERVVKYATTDVEQWLSTRRVIPEAA